MPEKKKNNNILDPKQYEAVDKMKNGCIVDGDTGSGKSRTGIYYYFKENGGCFKDGVYRKMKNPKDLYIITTAKKRDSLDFEKELSLFLLSPNPKLSGYSNRVVIDSWNNIQKYKHVKGAFFIFDEDKITGYGAWSHAFMRLAKQNNWILLSATPGDTWEDYITVFIANGFYKNKNEFADEHFVYSRFTKYPKVDKYINVARLIRLRDSIIVHINIIKKTVRHHIDIPVDYDKDLYRLAVKKRWDPYKKEPIQQASVLCYILRKIVNSDQSRINALMEILEKNDKAIIFYNYNYELDMLRHLFWDCYNDVETYDYDDDNRFEVYEWNGSMHQEIPKNKNRWVYLVQYTAGCEGWNCITTDTIIFFSQNYSYKVMEQACGRIDRLNTPYVDLYYYHLKSKSGIDNMISLALSRKQKFNESRYAKQLRFY